MTKLALLDDNEAIQRIASGTLSRTIAKEYNVTPFAIRKRLALHPDYPQAVKAQAESLVEQATEYAMACNNKNVAIARVRVDTAFKWAAARDPEHFGKQDVSVSVNVHVAVLDLQATDLLDKLRVVDQPIALAHSSAPLPIK